MIIPLTLISVPILGFGENNSHELRLIAISFISFVSANYKIMTKIR